MNEKLLVDVLESVFKVAGLETALIAGIPPKAAETMVRSLAHDCKDAVVTLEETETADAK